MTKTLNFKSQDGTRFELSFLQIGETVTNVQVYMPVPDIFLERTAPNLNQFKSPLSPHSFIVSILPTKPYNEKSAVFITEQTETLIINTTI